MTFSISFTNLQFQVFDNFLKLFKVKRKFYCKLCICVSIKRSLLHESSLCVYEFMNAGAIKIYFLYRSWYTSNFVSVILFSQAMFKKKIGVILTFPM